MLGSRDGTIAGGVGEAVGHVVAYRPRFDMVDSLNGLFRVPRVALLVFEAVAIRGQSVNFFKGPGLVLVHKGQWMTIWTYQLPQPVWTLRDTRSCDEKL